MFPKYILKYFSSILLIRLLFYFDPKIVRQLKKLANFFLLFFSLERIAGESVARSPLYQDQ